MRVGSRSLVMKQYAVCGLALYAVPDTIVKFKLEFITSLSVLFLLTFASEFDSMAERFSNQ